MRVHARYMREDHFLVEGARGGASNNKGDSYMGPSSIVGVSDHRDLNTPHPGLEAALAAANAPAEGCRHASHHIVHCEVACIEPDPFDGATQRSHRVLLRVWCGECATPFVFGRNQAVYATADLTMLIVATAPRAAEPAEATP